MWILDDLHWQMPESCCYNPTHWLPASPCLCPRQKGSRLMSRRCTLSIDLSQQDIVVIREKKAHNTISRQPGPKPEAAVCRSRSSAARTSTFNVGSMAALLQPTIAMTAANSQSVDKAMTSLTPFWVVCAQTDLRRRTDAACQLKCVLSVLQPMLCHTEKT